jgi:hypothetical protein
VLTDNATIQQKEQLMKAVTQARAIFFGLSTILLVSCSEAPGSGQRGFESQYSKARTALEQGNYKSANRLYARMLPQSGPFKDRIQVEYAHSLLRSGEFEKASQMAGEVANRSDGSVRAAALSVKGTADHEVALKLLHDGDLANGTVRLKAAQKALAEVLRDHPSFDPVGSLAGRQASIEVRLKKLN